MDEERSSAVADIDGADRDFAVRARAAAHRPALSVAGPYGRPLHAFLVTVPIGAWTCAFAFDIASLTVEARPYARPAQWLVLIGIVSGVVAAATGLVDFRRLTKGTHAHRVATTHLGLMGLALVLFVVSFVLRRADDSQFLDGTPVAAVVAAGVALLVLLVGAWLGGRLTYTYGVRVVDEADQLEGYVPAPVERGPRSANGAGES